MSERVQLRGKAAAGIERWSAMQQQQQPVAKDASPSPPPLLVVARETPTRGRPVTELVTQLQQLGSDAEEANERTAAASKRSSPWSSSVGKRLNFREQTRPHSRSLDEGDDEEGGEQQQQQEEAADSPERRTRAQTHGGADTPVEGDDTERQESSPPPPAVRREARPYKLRSSTAPLPGGVGVADRLRALRRSGADDWKKRVSPRTSPDRPNSQIADLQSQLIQEENEGWRKRQTGSGCHDEARSLTVRSKLDDPASQVAAERLSGLLASPLRRPVPRRSLACSPPPPPPAASAGRPDSYCFEVDDEATSTSSFLLASVAMSEAAQQFFPTLEQEDLQPPPSSSAETAASAPEEDESAAAASVAEIEADAASAEIGDLVPIRRRPMPQNRRRAQKNPVRARAELTSAAAAAAVRQRESAAGTPPPPPSGATREEKALSQVNKGLAKAAIQGLQAKVDLDAISLQRADPEAPVGPFGAIAKAHKSLMLIQVKGRRHAQARLVRPCLESVSIGDCYLLVARDAVFLWQGVLANVLEAAKASELAKWIAAKRALGYAGDSAEPLILRGDDANADSSNNKAASADFWRRLGCREPPQAGSVRRPLADEEDAVYEQLLADSNAFYRVDAEAAALVPLDEHWGLPPSHRLLESPTADAVVCDFGSEVYLWCAKRAGQDTRRLGVKLAKLLFNSPYDYSDCLLSPLDPRLRLGDDDDDGGEAANDDVDDDKVDPAALRGDRRPDWCLLGKVNENGETVLFREKFTDWPDSRGLIGQRHLAGGGASQSARPGSGIGGSQWAAAAGAGPPDWQLEPCDPAEMLAAWRAQPPACLELEGSRLGRGAAWTEVVDGLRRSFQVETLSVRAWLVTAELERRELPPESVGQLHSRCICLVRWQYRLTSQTGKLASSSSAASSAASTGRDRCVYFYWQGAAAGQKERGAGALLTVQLDEERCPQVHVAEGEEPPAFARVFQGAAVLHSGSREDPPPSRRLFLVRGQELQESVLVEVPCQPESLRPRGCFLLLVAGGGCCGGASARGFVWLGARTASWYRDLAAQRARAYEDGTPPELGLAGRPLPADAWTTVEQRGGAAAACSEFCTLLGGRPADSLEDSAEEEKEQPPSPIRAFKFASGAREQLQFAPLRDAQRGAKPESTHGATPFPCQLAALRALPQPSNAFVLFDCGSHLYLWQGWNPTEAAEAAFHAGSSLTRFEAEKRAVLRTAIGYGQLTGISPDCQLLVFNGSEPPAFRQLFPHWTPPPGQSEASAAKQQQQPPARSLQSVLDQLCNLTFGLAELQRRPLPEGVDPSRLEAHLADAEFDAAFGMSRSAFGRLSEWRKVEIKKGLGLH